MPTAPSNSISLAESYLAASLAASVAFQSLVGAADATEALESIYFEGLPPPADGDVYTPNEFADYCPYALIWTDPEGGFELKATARGGGGVLEFDQAGKLKIELIRQITEDIADDRAEVNRTFRNIAGAICDQMAARSGSAGYLEFKKLRAVGPYRFTPDRAPTEGDAQGYEIEVDYDQSGGGGSD